MERLSVWSTRLAEAVTPDEVELAPLVVEAYLAGGKARADLYRPPNGGAVGGFGPGGAVMVFPWILRGLAVAAPLISAMLAAAPHINDLLDIVKGGFDVHEAIASRKKKAAGASAEPYVLLQKTMVVLDRELAAVPLSDEERDHICYQVMRTLLEAPREAEQVVRALEEASHGA